ncbi:MAG TPA: GHKL domain-containing protein [Clostridia bacterium]|nr:GHKL domain-containing protein [Clostridia bacterium]
MTAWMWGLAALVVPGIALAGFFAVRAYLARLVDRRIAAYQNDLMAKHIEEVHGIYRQMRGWRHDYHNHIQAMKAYRALGQNDKLDAYLIELDRDLTRVDQIVKSGNVMVDAIVNSKLSLAKANGIRIHAKAVVPMELALSELDLCVVIGNLLDNAMEACLRLEDASQRFIRVYIDIKKDQLYLSVTNASGGPVRKFGGRYLSSKSGIHGFGLVRVDKIIDK